MNANSTQLGEVLNPSHVKPIDICDVRWVVVSIWRRRTTVGRPGSPTSAWTRVGGHWVPPVFVAQLAVDIAWAPGRPSLANADTGEKERRSSFARSFRRRIPAQRLAVNPGAFYAVDGWAFEPSRHVPGPFTRLRSDQGGIQQPPNPLHLSTAARSKSGARSRVKFQSAGRVKIRSARTGLCPTLFFKSVRRGLAYAPEPTLRTLPRWRAISGSPPMFQPARLFALPLGTAMTLGTTPD
jgi:transposase